MKKLTLLAAIMFACVQAQAVQVQGHRGTRGTRPENTLPAFEEALRVGVDVLEMDMGVTKDGVIVISHEPGINPDICLDPDGKTLEKMVPFKDLTLEQVKKYDCGTIQNPRFHKQTPVPGTRIPTLEEVFAMVENSKLPAAARVEFNIETKIFPTLPDLAPAPEKFAAMFAAIVKQHGLEKRVILQSFDVRTLKAMKKINPGIRTAQLTYEELLDFVPSLKAAGTDIWSPDGEWITAGAVKDAQAAGIPVAAWTLDDKAAWDLALAAGVDAIITDYPADLINYLQEKKLR